MDRKQLEELMQKHRNIRQEEIAGVAKAIVDLDKDEEIRKVPEPVFRELFYPYLSGDRDETQGAEVVAQWAGVAGSTSAEVSVVDSEGVEVFRVPPMLDTNLVNLTGRKVKLTSVFKQYVDEMRIHEGMATASLTQGLAAKQQELVSSDAVTTNDEKWGKIAAYYSKNHRPGTVPTAPVVQQNDDDGFVEG